MQGHIRSTTDAMLEAAAAGSMRDISTTEELSLRPRDIYTKKNEMLLSVYKSDKGVGNDKHLCRKCICSYVAEYSCYSSENSPAPNK